MGRHRIETEYRLPRSEYMSTLWLIRCYRDKLQEYEAILDASPEPADGQPRGSGISDPTFRKAARLAEVTDTIRIIEAGLAHIPSEYRQGVLRAIIEREPYPDYATRRTWARWRQRFVFWVAVESGLHHPEKFPE